MNCLFYNSINVSYCVFSIHKGFILNLKIINTIKYSRMFQPEGILQLIIHFIVSFMYNYMSAWNDGTKELDEMEV